jgi:hypothetical protein
VQVPIWAHLIHHYIWPIGSHWPIGDTVLSHMKTMYGTTESIGSRLVAEAKYLYWPLMQMCHPCRYIRVGPQQPGSQLI